MKTKQSFFKIKLIYLSLLFSVLNLVLYHFFFYKYVLTNTDISSWNGLLLFISLSVLAVVLNFLVFYLLLAIPRNIGKWIMSIFFIINSIAIYFIKTYGVIIDISMIGNVFNTHYDEASSFFSFGLLTYVLILGVLPSYLLFRFQIVAFTLKRFFYNIGITLIFLLTLIYVNAPNWLWIDKNSTTLGALVMPWSYVVNTSRYFSAKQKQNKKQIPLPDAVIKNEDKTVMILVIGESARSNNFSLYGYKKNTNPLLSQMSDVHHYTAQSCATYTTAGVKCILSHKHTAKLYEILPSYLFRNNVEVIWRTTNWGEPTVRIDTYQNRDDIKKDYKGNLSEYDEILFSGLKEQILQSPQNKILIILHTSTSHGPTYNKKYPAEFEHFKPVCQSVELAECSQEELINAYDNTIVYTDYLLATLINQLKQLEDYKTGLLYISDHGESLGENNLYMHGLPVSIAPKEQLNIPFIVWSSPNSKQAQAKEKATQHNVFHSVLDFLSVQSPIYDKEMSLFE